MKKILNWFLVGMGVLFAVQVIILVVWDFAPMKRQEFQGTRYQIHRGFGFPFGLIPLLGVSAAITDEPVRLVITDSTGRKVVKEYDVPFDIYEDYPDVFPPLRR